MEIKIFFRQFKHDFHKNNPILTLSMKKDYKIKLNLLQKLNHTKYFTNPYINNVNEILNFFLFTIPQSYLLRFKVYLLDAILWWEQRTV